MSIRLSVMLLAFMTVIPCVLQSKDGTVSVNVTTGAYAFDESGLRLEDFGCLLIPGKPNLPSRIISIAVPPGAWIRGVDIAAGERLVLPGECAIPPCPLPRVTGQEDPALYERDKRTYRLNHETVYGSDAPYPLLVGEFLQPSGYRKYNLADVRITPFIWHPVSKRLIFHPSIEVEVHYTLPEELPDDVVLYDTLPRTEAFAREIVFNYDEAQAWYPPGRSFGGRGLYELVVITLPSLINAVQPLVEFETARGRTVKVVTTSWISYAYAGYDLAECIRNFLRDNYPSDRWGIEHVLLAGHYDDVPIRRTAQDLGYGRPETDFYFAELTGPDHLTWDADGDRNWGEDTDPNDFYAEVNVGRIPWNDPATVEKICLKSIAFETSCDRSFKKNALLLGAFFWPDTDNAVLMEYKSRTDLHAWLNDWTFTRLYEKNADYSSSYPCDMELLNGNAIGRWSTGRYGFVNWAGHGSPESCHIYGLGTPAFSTVGDGRSLDDAHPAIIFANACSNADTDYTNIGMKMLEQGAVGFVGATKVSLGILGWSHPDHGCGSSMDYYFTKNVTQGEYTQGESLARTVKKMYNAQLFAYPKYELFEWSSLWGIPTLKLGVHAPLEVHLPEGMPLEACMPGVETAFTVEVRSCLENYVPGSGLLHYRFDAAEEYETVSLTALGNDLFEAVLPGAAPGDRPECYFSFTGDGGSTTCLPPAAPDEIFTLDVAFTETVFHDDFETDLGWTTENHNIADGEWERGDPEETSAQPEDDHSDPGTNCYVTGKLGEPMGLDDLDGGPTHLITPKLDLVEGDMVSFRVWFFQSFYGGQQPFEVHISNDDGANWTEVLKITHRPGWHRYAFEVADFVTPTSDVKVRFTAVDEPNDDVVEAAVDEFKVVRHVREGSLWADAYAISVSERTVILFRLDAEAANAGRPYLLLGSLSGTDPGFTLPSGVVLPLNWDYMTDFILSYLNTQIFGDFYNTLDAEGRAEARLDTLGPVDPALIGWTAQFAFLLGCPPGLDFVSNAIPVTFEPF